MDYAEKICLGHKKSPGLCAQGLVYFGLPIPLVGTCCSHFSLGEASYFAIVVDRDVFGSGMEGEARHTHHLAC